MYDLFQDNSFTPDGLVVVDESMRALPQEYKFVATLIKDSIANIENKNAYYKESFLFLVDATGELGYWLDLLPDHIEEAIKVGIDKYLVSKRDLYM